MPNYYSDDPEDSLLWRVAVMAFAVFQVVLLLFGLAALVMAALEHLDFISV